ncbi:uncharacterized protein [Typha latifolia]|uniref:uncharacterized protein isoform X2 n=1 Tax=Typha latifolia TaxID=4733 RepID=UPI003C2AC23F
MFSILLSTFHLLASSLCLPSQLQEREREKEKGGLEMAGCNEEAPVQNKYAGIAPKKPPLIAKDHERAYFDSADWVLGKQGVNNTAVTAIESLKPKLKRTPHHQLPPRKPACTSDGENSSQLAI